MIFFFFLFSKLFENQRVNWLLENGGESRDGEERNEFSRVLAANSSARSSRNDSLGSSIRFG